MVEKASEGEANVIYDWNEIQPQLRPSQPFDLDDETLRDGVQSPSVTDPPLETGRSMRP